MKKFTFLIIALFALNSISWSQLSSGDIAFTAMNVDGDDDFAIVALVDIPANSTIFFSDNEPNADGSGFLDFNEGTLQWETGASVIAAGTIVVFTDVDAGTNPNFGASVGTLSIASFDSGLNLSGSGDALYAVEGSPDGDNITAWLAGIQNAAGVEGANFSQTGLASGTTFIEFYSSGSPDGGYYSGLRNGLSSFADYLSLLGSNTNWTTEDSNGELILPISTSPFTVGGNIPPVVTNISTTPAIDITSSDAVSVSADVTDTDGSITGVELHWGTTSGSLGTTILMSNTGGDTYTTDTDIPAQADGTTVYYEIVATDDEPESTTAGEFSYTVNDPATTALPYVEDFATGFGDCYTFNVAGIKTWYYYSGGQQVSANGFGGDNPEEDWLILPGIDFDSYSYEVMTFNTYAQYGTNDANNYLKLFYSSDYPGLGDPSGYTWVELTYNQPTGINNSSEVSAPSGNIDLTGISGSMVYIAFKYLSTDSPTRWSVDNIVIGETLDWYNLQWVSFEVMPSWYNAEVYAQAYKAGVTSGGGQGAGIECWVGYSLIDEDPSTSDNFTYIPLNYFGDSGDNDEYKGLLGADVPMAPGTYYVVARWSYLGGPYHYGGYGGQWNNNSAYLNIYESAASTTWTGAVNDNWFDGGNWSNDVPGYNSDAIIPTGLTNYPKTTGGTAMCNNILVQSDASGDASFIEYGNLIMLGTATVEKYISADTYHSFSPSVQGQTANIFHLAGSTGLDVYLYGHSEANNADPESGYYEIVDVNTALMATQGYAVFPDGANATPPVTGYNFMQEGVLNAGSFGSVDNLSRTGAGSFAGFNYYGNPYPSSIDWEAGSGWTKTNVDASIWSENGGSWAQYISPGPGINGGSNIVGPGQGFFVEVTSGFTTGTLMIDNDARTNTTTPYLKSTVSNYVKLAATGNDRTDEMVVRFEENATAQFEGQFDGLKLAAGDYEYPQIYSIADKNLAYNALPETETVQLGFHCGVNGQYTIEAVDINEIAEVWLEDTFTGIVTNLATSSYTFSYSTSDEVNRFVLHFTALSTDELNASVNNIYAYNNNVYIHMISNHGIAQVYNMTGQLVNTYNLTSGTNQFAIDQRGNYIIKVVCDSEIATKKVNIQ